ncbi:hypothetical protein [Mangrovicoccus sp. HB161399]|uniref:hypothetical protein n=1 Tax=Mangrovicoccus sp. HB161399 TaxID=2720392 RepID=UPI0015536379|nr:hypothetical protein [Mangrovicoccus sp. HB161399]
MGDPYRNFNFQVSAGGTAAAGGDADTDLTETIELCAGALVPLEDSIAVDSFALVFAQEPDFGW